MTSEPAKKPGTRVEPEYEDDLRELFERLLQGARIAAEPAEGGDESAAGPASGPQEGKAEEREKTGKRKKANEPEKAGTETEAEEESEAEEETAAEEEAEAEPAAEAEKPAAGEDEPAKGRLRRRPGPVPGLRRWAAPALAVLVAAAVGASGFFAGRATSADEDAPRRQVAVRAGEIANTLYNYDYRQVDQYLTRQSSVMTGKLAAEAKQSRDTISAIITGGKLVWTSRVTRVYVADVSATAASVIVELNGKVTNSKGISNLTGTVIRFELARERGRWLVSKAPATLSVGAESATDLDGKPVPSASPSASPTKKSP
ncbi:hypothetical protein [Actinomadura sp. GTD37]|uniref:hypothetical protein n=1 Tax=Actinomadura sp. GTD37 TaxID=1778030 RepID=UPI0035C085B8